MKTPEGTIELELLRQQVRFRPEARVPIVLHASVLDRTGRSAPGPHPIGRVRVRSDGRMTIKLVGTQAARDARALLADGIVGVVWDAAAGAVRLGVFDSC